MNENNISWGDINWALVDRKVRRLQERIYKASKANNKGKVRCLQKRLLKGIESKQHSVRRVTTLNRGKNSPGIDKKTYDTPEKKEALVREIGFGKPASAIKRVYIPKPGKSELRPLGLPTIGDRACQAWILLALEPEWEALFEGDSYGFRPGRSCQDAIEDIYLCLRNKKKKGTTTISAKERAASRKWILDADIAKCFDRISHDYLLEKLDTLPEITNLIQGWLTAGIVDAKFGNKVYSNDIGTPQGGVISPFLSNVALHGMSNHVQDWYKTANPTPIQYKKRSYIPPIRVIRYADDFVVIHPERTIIEGAKGAIADFLRSGPKLELSEAKTSIVPSTESFNFLGFTIMTMYKNGIQKCLIKPSKESVSRLRENVSKAVSSNKSASSYALINILAPKIVGWGNYFRHCEKTKTFSSLDKDILLIVKDWVFRRDKRSSKETRKNKYFPPGRTFYYRDKPHKNNWVLVGQRKAAKGITVENFLPKISWIPHEKHVKVRGDVSPYNGDRIYWGQRTIKYGGLNHRQRKLLKRQNGYCTWCGTKFDTFDQMDVDHVIPLSKGGKDFYDNLQLLKTHCHIEKSKTDGSRHNDSLIKSPYTVRRG
jgi:group II intron reverse transcriptase/maturase